MNDTVYVKETRTGFPTCTPTPTRSAPADACPASGDRTRPDEIAAPVRMSTRLASPRTRRCRKRLTLVTTSLHALPLARNVVQRLDRSQLRRRFPPVVTG